MGKKEKTVEKKKHLSRFGKIEISKKNEWSKSVNGYAITPYMQDMMLYAGQDDNYLRAQEQIKKYLSVKSDDSQIKNLVSTYGNELENVVEEIAEELENKGSELSSKVGSEEYAYAMIDGSMVFTREEDSGWKEIKLGRIFVDSDLFQINEKRRWLRESLYTAHFGDSQAFMGKFEPLLDHFEPLKERLVCINDGAKWIWNAIDASYPRATQILDFFHACEYLTDFAKLIFSNKEEQQTWISEQRAALLKDEVENVIEKIEEMQLTRKVQEQGRTKILSYYKRNKHRMMYETFRNKGMLIGSGPIESAHRVVIQKRMKQSGQRWTIKGGQEVANLRVAHINKQWDTIIKLIKTAKRA